MYGKHACLAALRNPDRQCKRFCVTEAALAFFADALKNRRDLSAEVTSADRIDRHVGQDARHQGAALLVEPLQSASPVFTEKTHTVAIADHVTDPQNIGGLLRAAAAFGVDAIFLHDRNSPQETGALAKAASGHLDTVPLVREKNLANLVRRLQKEGFSVAALAADGSQQLYDGDFADRQAFIFGSEGEGVRRLLRELSDVVVSVPMHPRAESLNVAMTAGVTLSCRYAKSLG